MKKIYLFLLIGLVFVSTAFATQNSVNAVETGYSLSWISVPTSLIEGSVGTFKIIITSASETTLHDHDCTLMATHEPLGSQSMPSMQGSGTVNGTAVSVDQGSSGMSTLSHTDVNLPATFILTLKNSSEVQPTNTTSKNVSIKIKCGASFSTVKIVTIKDSCHGKTCNCGTLPICPTTKPTAAIPTNSQSTPSATVAPENTNTPSITPTSLISPTVEYSTLQNFFKENSNSTKLKELTKDELKHVENLILDDIDSNMIEFFEVVDLSDVSLEQLEALVILSENGIITLDSHNLAMLDIPAQITMRGLTFANTPKILRNGVNSDNFVKNIQYNSSTGILTFEVTGFSTYKVIQADEHTQSKNFLLKNIVENWLIYIVIIFIILISVIFVGFIIIKGKIDKKRKLVAEKQTNFT